MTRSVAPAGLAIAAMLAAPTIASAMPADVVAQAAAKKQVQVRSVSRLPRTVTAGNRVTLRTQIKNITRKAKRPRVVVQLKSLRYAPEGRSIVATKGRRLAAGKSRRYTFRTRIPRTLDAGRYYVSVCVFLGDEKSGCRIASRRVRVLARPTTPGNPGNPGTPGNPGNPGQDNRRFSVLVYTETPVSNSTLNPSTTAGIKAIQELGRQENFRVDVAEDSTGVFTEANLEKYRTVVYLNSNGDTLTGNEQAAFEAFYKDGGGFLAINDAIGAEPTWDFMTDLLGTRATGQASTAGEATIKVADRVHDASKTLPERWTISESFHNFAQNVRGQSHVLATVDENTYTGGSMGFDHPVAWCKDYQGGRSFYTGLGDTPESFQNADFREHLAGAINWAAGQANPVYSDCGATVLANYQQTKISAPPNLNEPIGFDQLPDGRVIQTARLGQVRLHDPAKGTSTVIANIPVYAHSEDGLYGPAVDNNFAQNKWVYLFYSPLTMEGVSQIDGKPFPTTTPGGNAPTTPQPSLDAWDQWRGYFQLSRFKFVDGETPSLDLTSEQKILKVEVNRGACCHVAGDIDFDKHNNLWLVTGDDTPSGAGNAGGWGPHNDMKTNESQLVRVLNADGGTFTLSFAGETTAALPYNATGAQVQAALEALDAFGAGDVLVTGNNASTGNLTINFRGQYAEENVVLTASTSTGLTMGGTAPTAAVATNTTTQGSATANETQTVRVTNASGGTFTLTFGGGTTAAIPWDATAAQIQSALEALDGLNPGDVTVGGGPVWSGNVTVTFTGTRANTNVDQMTAAGSLTVAPLAYTATTQEGDYFQPPWFDARRSSLNTNDLRGKILRINVNEDGSYTSVPGNLFTGQEEGGGKTRPEIYAMGFRNPFRIQVDENDVAYITDYSPDTQVPGALRGPAGTGRMEIVRRPSNYGWPLCMSPTLPMYEWDFNTSTTLGQPHECDNPNRGPANESRHNTGLLHPPAIVQPDLWYSFQDPTPLVTGGPPRGTPCLESYNTATIKECPLLFPELGAGGVGPHGATKYKYDPSNPSTTKFPPYYDNAVFFGEFTRDTLKEIRLDSEGKILKINNLLNCGAVGSPAAPFECDNPMDMQFGKDGAFYLLTYGDGFFAANADAGMYKWEYVKGTRAPQAVLNTDRTNGALPLTVRFTSEGSRDPDPSDSIEFLWNFGDGTTSTDQNPTHTYTAAGVYTATLTVTDSSGKTDTKSTTITAGNTAPTVTVTTPVNGGFFEWGQNIPFTVTVTDPEDGPIDCSRVEVTFVLVHDQHGHGEDSTTGCTGVLTTDAEMASHGGYIAGGISATYTDRGANGQPALTTIAQNVVQIKRQQVEYAQEQSGTTTANVQAPETDPFGGLVRGSLNDGDWIALNNAYNLTNMNKTVTFRFASNAAAGSDRVNVEIRDGSPTGTLLTTATLKATGDNNAYTSQTFPLDYTGSKRLYLVFRQVPGGPTAPNAGWGNLNWVEFSGAGVGVAP